MNTLQTMHKLRHLLFPALLLSLPLSALADSWKDHRHGTRYASYKEEYWEGNCKVKRKMKKDGEYKEERKCKAPKGYYQAAPVYYERAPVYRPVHAPIVIAPGIAVQGTVRISH